MKIEIFNRKSNQENLHFFQFLIQLQQDLRQKHIKEIIYKIYLMLNNYSLQQILRKF